MPTFNDRLESLKADPRFKAWTPEQQKQAIVEFTAGVTTESQARTKAGLEANQQTTMGRIGNQIGGFGTGMKNAMTLGYANPAIAAASPVLSRLVPELAGGRDTSVPELAGQDAAFAEQAPLATRAGTIAGNFVGPAARMIGAVGGAVGGAVRPWVGAGGSALVNLGMKPLESEFGQRFLTNLITNSASGAAAIAVQEAARYRDESGLATRLGDAAYAVKEAAKNPLTGALIVGGSALQARYARPPAAEDAFMREKYERITGKKVPIETLTDSADTRAAYDAMARTPGVQDRVAKQKAEAIGGLKQVLEDIRDRSGAAGGGREALRGKAASAVRELVGDEAKSPITAERRGQFGAAMAQEAASPDAGRQLLAGQIVKAGIDAARDGRSRFASSEMESIFKQFEKLTDSNAQVTATDLEELRQATVNLSKYIRTPMNAQGAISGDRTAKEAGLFLDAITEAARRTTPNYYNALNVSKTLRRMEDALGDVPIVRLDDAQASKFFREGGGDFPGRWKALTDNARPEDVAALRGWYWYRLVRAVSNGRTNAISSETLDKLTAREGPFNSEVVDTVMPGALPELRQYAQFTEKMFGKGRFGPEGSATAGRAVQYGAQAASGAALGAAAHFIGSLSNPYAAVVTLLGPIGVKTVLRSAMGGNIEAAMQNAVRQGPTPMARSVTALRSQLPQSPQLLSTLPQISTQESP